MSAEQVLQALGGDVGTGMAKCPAHDDHTPSLSVKDGNNGAVWFKCFAGCRWQDIQDRVREAFPDLLPSRHRSNARPTRGGDGGRIVAIYDYRDEAGQLLFQSVRYEPKRFAQRQPRQDGRWIWNLNAVRLVLYRLPELLKAMQARATILLVEGEKDVDRLRALGFAATCNPLGAGKWLPEYTAALKGARLVILPDNDGPGLAHAQKAAAALHGAALALVIVRVPEPHKDVSDWIAAGAKKADLDRLIESAKPWTPGSADLESDWPDPKPIIAEVSAVPAFDADTLLPEALRKWVMDGAERMPCPPDYIAAAAVVFLGSIVGARCAIKPKSRDSWLVVPNLWGGIVGSPSAKKSPAWGVAMQALDRLIAKAGEAHAAALAEYETTRVVFDAQRQAIEGQIKKAVNAEKGGDPTSIAKELREHCERAPKEPPLRRFKSNDTTVEKLGELLQENPTGLLVLRDELVGLISSWDREGHDADRAFFLEAWNGNQNFDTDRIGRGHIQIPNVCVAIFGGIQPDRLARYLEQATHLLANDGMLQRIQVLVYPDPAHWEWRDRMPDKAARDEAVKVFDALADFDPVAWGAAPADEFAKFPYFTLDQEAQDLFIKWSEDMHQKRLPAEQDPIVEQHLAKYDKLFPALALIFHLVDCAAHDRRGAVSMDSASRAAAWCEYLEAHARRCYGLLRDGGMRAAQALAKNLERGVLPDGFTAREVSRKEWRGLKTEEAVQSALHWLEDLGWVRSQPTGGTGPGGGRPTVRYHINPKIKRGGQ
jgi:5S rRNA maturation endonuclease (ribonuclease M5)